MLFLLEVALLEEEKEPLSNATGSRRGGGVKYRTCGILLSKCDIGMYFCLCNIFLPDY